MSNERLFIGDFPTGIVFADRHNKEDGDWKKIAFVSYEMADLTFNITEEEKVSDKFNDIVNAIKSFYDNYVVPQIGAQYAHTTTQRITLGYGRKNRPVQPN